MVRLLMTCLVLAGLTLCTVGCKDGKAPKAEGEAKDGAPKKLPPPSPGRGTTTMPE